MSDKKGTDDQAGNDPRNNGNNSHGPSVSGSEAHKSAPTDANPPKDKKAEAAATGAQPEADDTAAKSVAKSADGTAAKTADKTARSAQASGGDSRPEPAARQQAESKATEHKPTEPQSGMQKQPQDSQRSADHKRKAEAPAAAAPSEPAAGKAPSGGGSGRNGGGNEPRKGGKLAAVIAIVALLIALIALAGAAWVWHRSELRTAEFSSRINMLQGDVEDSVRSQVKSQVAGIRSRLDDVASSNAQQAQALSDLKSALKTTQLQMAGLTQQMQGSVRRWQVQQIEQLLITANRRLQLYDEPAQASAALKLASQAIARLNDPRLFDVRKRIIDNIAALDALPSPDTEGMALTLSAFIDQVPDLPLASDVPANYEPQDTADAAAGANASGESGIDLTAGWQHFVNSVGTALHSMVTIRRADGTQAALLPPDQVYFLTQNLMLELRSARLALLQGNGTLYRESLSTAIAWLKQYFDTSAPAVKAMIDRLGQMQNVKLDWQAPDITGSLFALRDYMQARSAESRAQQQQSEAEAAPSGKPQQQSEGQTTSSGGQQGSQKGNQ